MVTDEQLIQLKDSGLPMQEIASQTGLPIGSVKSRLYRLRHGRWAVGKWIRLDDAKRLIREAYEAGQYGLGIEDLIEELGRIQK